MRVRIIEFIKNPQVENCHRYFNKDEIGFIEISTCMYGSFSICTQMIIAIDISIRVK